MSLFNYFKRQSTAERCTEEREIPAIREPVDSTSSNEPSTSASAEKRSEHRPAPQQQKPKSRNMQLDSMLSGERGARGCSIRRE